MRTILLLCLSILFLPLTLAAEGLTVAGGTLDTDYSYKDNVYTVLTGTKLTFSGTTTVDRIVIAEGVTADITLSDLSIDVSEIYDVAAIRLEKKVKLTLHITGTESTLKSGNNAAGIGLSDECDLHITAESETPRLTVLGGNNSSDRGSSGAAIGSNLSEEGKASIKISNGTISATGGTGGDWGKAGDGIGQSGDRKLQMAIVFDGGKITATGGNKPWGGSAGYGINGDVTVNNGIFANCTFKDITIQGGTFTNCTFKDNTVINDGTFTNCPISGTKATINSGTLTNSTIDGSFIINGGTITGTSRLICYPTGVINGGNITIEANSSTAIEVATGKTLTINGGDIDVKGVYNYPGIGSQSNNSFGDIIINNGYVSSKSGGGHGQGIGQKSNAQGTGKVFIHGGTVLAYGADGYDILGIGGTLQIDGGTAYIHDNRGGNTHQHTVSDGTKTVYRAILSNVPDNITDVSVDDKPYYISQNFKDNNLKNKLFIYLTGDKQHTIVIRTNDKKVTTYTTEFTSDGVDKNKGGKGFFIFSTGTETTPTDQSAVTFKIDEDYSTTYNKENNEFTVTLKIEEKVTTRSTAMNSVQLALSDGTIAYFSDRQTVTGSGDYTFTFDTKGLDAGSYTLTATYGGTATSLTADKQTTKLTIEQAEGSKASDYKEPNTLTATYGQTLADITLPDGWAWDAPKTSVGNVSSSPNTFAATFTPADTKNYKTVSKVLSVTVNKATASDPGTPAVLSPSTITYGTKLSDIKITAGWQWADGAIVPTVINSGYTASFSVTDETNYDWSGITGYDSNTHQVIRTVTVTVNKADLTADYFTFTAPTNLVYDGQAKAATVTAKDGLTGVGAITIKYYKDGATEVSEPTEVGTYTVKIDVAEGGNCNSISNLTTLEWTFTILPKSNPPVNPPDDPDDPDDPAPVHYTVTLPAIEGATTDPAAGSYEVESWGSFSFLLTLDEGYRTDSHPVVTARGETLTPNASTGKYTIRNVRSDITVEITGIVKDVATGNETLSDGFHITTSGRLLLVTVPRAIRLYLTDTSGRLILTRQLPAGDTRIDNLAAGVYLLTLEGEKTKKIIIR